MLLTVTFRVEVDLRCQPVVTVSAGTGTIFGSPLVPFLLLTSFLSAQSQVMLGFLRSGSGSFDFPSSIQDVYAEVERALIQGGHVNGKAGLWLVILDKFDHDTANRALEVRLVTKIPCT